MAMKTPFAFVLYIERDNDEHHLVSLWQTLDAAEEALRDYAASMFVGFCDGEVVETLAEDGIRVRIFACTEKRNMQTSTELQPFARPVLEAA
jgi:hypothetical protein